MRVSASTVATYIKSEATYVHITPRSVRVTTVVVENSITHSEYVFVALVIQHAMRMRRFVMGDLPGSKIHIIL